MKLYEFEGTTICYTMSRLDVFSLFDHPFSNSNGGGLKSGDITS